MKRPVAATIMATIALTGAGMLTTSSAFAAEGQATEEVDRPVWEDM